MADGTADARRGAVETRPRAPSAFFALTAALISLALVLGGLAHDRGDPLPGGLPPSRSGDLALADIDPEPPAPEPLPDSEPLGPDEPEDSAPWAVPNLEEILAAAAATWPAQPARARRVAVGELGGWANPPALGPPRVS